MRTFRSFRQQFADEHGTSTTLPSAQTYSTVSRPKLGWGLTLAFAFILALVLAGLASQGTTTVAESHHIDRGYPYFAEMLRGLGADVERVDVPAAVT